MCTVVRRVCVSLTKILSDNRNIYKASDKGHESFKKVPESYNSTEGYVLH